MVIVLIYLISLSVVLAIECPCSDKSLCAPLQIPPRKELYAFGSRMYRDYVWDNLTTIAWWGPNIETDPTVICMAHAKGVRVVLPFGLDLKTQQLKNTDYTFSLVLDALKVVKDYYLDGVNFDFEDEMDKTDDVSRQLLSQLMKNLTETFHSNVPGSQVTFDAGWLPNVDVRFYDYKALADNSDFLIIMDYDEQSQIFGPCKAGATSDYSYLIKGMNAYTQLGISLDKLVMALPWYGHDFPCEPQPNSSYCPLAKAPWRGVDCTDLYATEYPYRDIIDNFLPISTTGKMWDPDSKSPWLNYMANGKPHQVWFDDIQSTVLKIQFAKKGNFRGVGMFTADYINYNDDSQVKGWWQAMNDFFI